MKTDRGKMIFTATASLVTILKMEQLSRIVHYIRRLCILSQTTVNQEILGFEKCLAVVWPFPVERLPSLVELWPFQIAASLG